MQESYYSWISGVIDNARAFTVPIVYILAHLCSLIFARVFSRQLAVYPGLIFDSAKSMFAFMGNSTLLGNSNFWDKYDSASEGDSTVFVAGLFSIQGAVEVGVRVVLCVLMVIPNLLCIEGAVRA